MPRKNARSLIDGSSPSASLRRRLLLGVGLLAACGGTRATIGQQNGAITGLTNYTTPDPGNLWTQGQDLSTYAIGQENVLANEDAIFAQMVSDVNSMQDQLQSMNGALARGFHAKPHACVLGTFNVASDGLSAGQQRGLFQSDAAYPVWVRFSNGVGFSEKDKNVDVRGLALKVMQVPGGGTQDFLMTNAPTTPAPDSRQFVNFAKAQVAATISGSQSLLGPISAMLQEGGYLLQPGNARILWYFVNQATPSVLGDGSVLGQRFWGGGAIELGDSNGTPANAMKFSAVPGIVQSDGSCQGANRIPNIFDDNYLRTDVKSRMAAGPTCISFEIQLQVDPAKQPIEDTSVEWLESDTPFVQVASVTIPQVDLDNDPSAQQEESFCNGLAFSPWHAMGDHRPLGNIMRARKTVYAGSASHRNGDRPIQEPTGNEYPVPGLTPPAPAAPGLDAGPAPIPDGDAGPATNDDASVADAGGPSCAGQADGLYCGSDGIGGDAGTLYQCSGGQLSVSQACTAGCQSDGNGADACN